METREEEKKKEKKRRKVKFGLLPELIMPCVTLSTGFFLFV